jgi:hypothetical protein
MKTKRHIMTSHSTYPCYQYVEGKGKVHVHTMKAYRGSAGTVTPFLPLATEAGAQSAS